MKNVSILAITLSILLFSAFTTIEDKLITKDVHISFFSHTAVEDIAANNYKVVSTLNMASGDVVFSVPMQSFEFENALMQKHFNGPDFLNTKEFPKAKFNGKINTIGNVDYTKDGTYNVQISGNLTIKDTSKPLSEKATITVEGEKISLDSKMKVVLANYGITFTKGKPSTNISKEVEVVVKAVYQSGNTDKNSK